MTDAASVGTGRGKAVIVQLVSLWLKRAGVTRQRLADELEVSYDQLYHRYLRQERTSVPDPQLDIALVLFFANQDRPARRCTVTEAARFCAAVGLDLGGYRSLLTRASFDSAAFRAAVAAQSGVVIGAAADQAVDWPAAQRLTAARDQLLGLSLDAETPPPGQLAPGSRLPHPFNPLFTGRAAALQRLAEAVRTSSAREVIAVTGIGGVGKSNLVSTFAYHVGSRFPGGVFWVDCSRPADVAAEVLACGAAGLFSAADWEPMTDLERERAVREHWASATPQLLIFDGLDDPALLHQLRPTYGEARIIVTSRRARWSAAQGVRLLPLAELDLAASVALLARYRPDVPASDPGLLRLASILAGLPLALHLTGSYLQQTFDPAASDPQQLADALCATDLFAHPALRGEGVEDSATGHTLNLAQTIDVSVRQLQDPADALALAVFVQSGFLAPGVAIPVWLTSAPPSDRQAVTRRLVQLGLVSDRRPGFALHPLVAAYARRVDAEGRAQGAADALLAEVAAAALADGDPERQRALWPHVQHRVHQRGGRTDSQATALIEAFTRLRALIGAQGTPLQPICQLCGLPQVLFSAERY